MIQKERRLSSASKSSVIGSPRSANYNEENYDANEYYDRDDDYYSEKEIGSHKIKKREDEEDQ